MNTAAVAKSYEVRRDFEQTDCCGFQREIKLVPAERAERTSNVELPPFFFQNTNGVNFSNGFFS